MNVVVAVVLFAGVAFLASFMARKRGYSHNQRIVLSAIAIGLLLWDLFRGDGGPSAGKLAVIGLAVIVLASSLLFLRRQSR